MIFRKQSSMCQLASQRTNKTQDPFFLSPVLLFGAISFFCFSVFLFLCCFCKFFCPFANVCLRIVLYDLYTIIHSFR